MITRLQQIQKSKLLTGKRIIVTGCGYKPVQTVFTDIVTGEPSHDSIYVHGQEMKMNIGTAIAGVLAINGANVHMVSKSEDKLKIIKQGLEKIVGDEKLIEYSAVDMLNRDGIKSFVANLPRNLQTYWVQSVGLGAGNYNLKNDNPYLPISEISPDLIDAELGIVKATDFMLKELLPIFKKQRESRVAIISSMSAVRGYERGAIHCAAKGAIDRYANVAMLEGYKHNIFVSTIRPGGIDTGMYDNAEVQGAIREISDNYKGLWGNQITLAPPTTVAEAVNYALTTSAHLTSLNLVAKGQFPNEGS